MKNKSHFVIIDAQTSEIRCHVAAESAHEVCMRLIEGEFDRYLVSPLRALLVCEVLYRGDTIMLTHESVANPLDEE